MAFWLDATGLLHVPQGNLIGPGFVWVSFANASKSMPIYSPVNLPGRDA